MSRFAIWRTLARRKIESLGLTVAAIAAAAVVVNQGPLIDNPVTAPVAHMVERAVPVTALTKTTATPAASATAWDLPNIDHAYVDKWIARFTGSRKRDMQIYLARMKKYEDLIVSTAEDKGVPKDLVYLAMIESGGDAKAKSPVGARGLWQFMTATARDYGLTSAERLDPVKSTSAALEYLGDLFDRFGSWYLAAAAYNTGQGRVAKVLKQVTGKTKGTDADFYRIASRLPRETRDYVPKLIAAARIAKNPAKYGFSSAG